MTRTRHGCRLLLLPILLLAAALRLAGLDWDGGIAAHPDERYVVGVAESLRWPDRLNPLEIAPSFAYGHLPLYLLALTGGLSGDGDVLMLGRALGALCDVLVVALTFELGHSVYGMSIGLAGAALVALMPIHVQQAHFYTADTLLTPLVLGALLFSVRLVRRSRSADALLAGAWAGLALGTKPSGALLLLPLGMACALVPQPRARIWHGVRVGVGMLVTFALTNPFAVREFSTFWRNITEQAAIASGALDVPYTRQYHATWPYLYPAVQLLWGMGITAGPAAGLGLACTLWQAGRRPFPQAALVLLSWTMPGLAFFGALYARFPRYLLPFVPLLALYAARLSRVLSSLPRLRSGYLLLLLLPCLLHSLACVSIYRYPHPWLATSEWFYEHAPAGAVIAVEEWDHPLPLHTESYSVLQMPIFDEDSTEKWGAMEKILAQADYVVIASQRGYGSLARWPARYPITARYYNQLFTGALGFQPVACFWRYPRLGPLVLVSDPTAGLDFSLPELCWPQTTFVLRLGRLDESFSVYDQPQAIIFERVRQNGGTRLSPPGQPNS